MRKITLLFIILFVSLQISAQEKLLTLEDVVFNSYSKLAPERINQLSPIPNTDKYSFVEKIDDEDFLMLGSVTEKESKKLLGLNDLNVILGKINEEELTRISRITWIDKNHFNFWSKQKLFRVNTENLSIQFLNSISENASNIRTAGDNKTTAFTIDNNLYLAVSETDLRKLTDNGDGIISGQSVHRNEFGINKGIFFSPDSKLLAYYHKDETMVTQYPLVEMGSTPAELKNIRYPMAGQTSEYVKIAVYNIETKNTVWLNTGEPADQYLTAVTWSPDSKFIFVAHLNRDQDHLRLIKYNALTGEKIKTLFEEKDDEFVEPENPLIFLPENNEKFLWFSERDGWNHLYLYDVEGNMINQVTKGKWVVLSFVGFDETGKNIFITATKDSPLETHLYKVSLQTSEIKRLTKPGYNHSIDKFDGKDLFVDTYQNMETPRIIDVLSADGESKKNLLNSANPLTEFKLGKTEINTIKADDGTDLYSRTIYPPDFDESKKYPVIFYVYGGPHAQLIKNSFPYGRYDFWFHYMAQNGYIIFTLDNRGSANRGLEFEQATFGRLGTVEVQDQLAGLNYLKTKNYVDAERVGVFGWSYGGFMTTSLMLRTADAFKVGVGGGAVIDWKFYEIMYTERYMDTPQKNPEGYEESSLLNYVDNLNGKLLLVHGTSDPTVVWQNTLEFAKKAANLNKPLDYFPYVGHGHGVGGKDVLHLYTKISQYFFDNL
ncbi:MAG: DPP IV N-terminal domain-containing protein [Melioribacteraceae bacterium]|nr:DPP IV N-terminal domain-containing protein [Melioribacteraceae bacterium]